MEALQTINLILIIHLTSALIILGYFSLLRYQPDNMDLFVILLMGPEILIYMVIYTLFLKGGKR